MRALLVVVVLWLSAEQAHACKLALSPFKLAPVEGDTAPPGAPNVVSKVIEPASRKTLGIPLGGCGSCDDIGRIRLTVSASDDRAQPAALGYRVTVVGDRGGMNMVLPDEPVAPHEGEIVLPFRGDAAFTLTLDVSAVDPSGNVGPPTRHVVSVPGAFPWLVAIGIGAPVLLVLAIIGILRRRRRR